MVLNSLSFCLSVKLLSSSYLNEILAGYSNLGCRLFSFITLSMSCHSLLAWRFLLIDQLLSLWESLCVLFVVYPLQAQVLKWMALSVLNILGNRRIGGEFGPCAGRLTFVATTGPSSAGFLPHTHLYCTETCEKYLNKRPFHWGDSDDLVAARANHNLSQGQCTSI